jgi:hypothetical protein
MEGKGYSWMFDAEDAEDDDDRRPLMEELEIDPADIIHKAKCALRPPKGGLGQTQDFWGPLSVVLMYASLLVWGNMAALSWILCLWVFGSSIIYFLVRVLGADVTLAHTLGSLGYNLLPLVISRVALLTTVGSTNAASIVIRALCTAWATFSASRWLFTADLASKRLLMVYPLGLYFYFFVALSTGV